MLWGSLKCKKSQGTALATDWDEEAYEQESLVGCWHNTPEGCTPTVESNCFLVALPFMAMAMPWMISGESGPTLASRKIT